LIEKDYKTKTIVRNKEKIKSNVPSLEIIEVQVTKPETLKDISKGIDVVISSIGITRQKDG